MGVGGTSGSISDIPKSDSFGGNDVDGGLQRLYTFKYSRCVLWTVVRL